MMNKTNAILPVAILAGINTVSGGFAAETIHLVELRCEYHETPLGIDVLLPRLSWQLGPEERGQHQSAYRILVASSPEKLEKNTADLWDTRKVRSNESIQMVYQGKALSSRQRCYWKVMAWDQNDRPSAWSETAMWSMGLLNATDWQAQWVGFDEIPEVTVDPVQKESKIVIKKALYGIPDHSTKQIDITKALSDQVAVGQFVFKVDNGLGDEDPAPGVVKKLELEYTINGKNRKLTLAENTEINLITGKAVRSLGNKRYLHSPYLRKEFQVSGMVERAVVYVTAQGFVEMHLNGQRVGDEFFTPGWTDYRKRIYYRAYDVTDLLRQGNNAIGGILGDGWFRGNISILGQNKYGDKLRLLSQLHIDYLDGRSETVVSDPSWKASFGPILESDMQAGEIYDARREMPGWDRSGFDDHQWQAVNTGSALNATPLIEAYPGVPVCRMQELPVVRLNEPVKGRQVFDMGQNFSGWIRLKVRGQAGDEIVMRFGEMLNEDGTVYTENLRSARATDTYILKGDGEEVWEPHFTFHGFRYVEVTGLSGQPTKDTITGIVVHSDAPMTSSFECSNPMLNQLHSNILWGQRSNYLEVPTDCPQRDERLGWTGDTQVYIRSGTYNQDVASFFTKWLMDLEDTLQNGVYGNQAPVFHGHGSPGWADAGIICPWIIYKVYGDTRVIEVHYDAMARFIEGCGRNGLNGLGDGFGDWLSIGSNTPKELISVTYYAYSTRLMAEMAEAVGKQEDAATYQDLFERIREHFQKSFIDAEGRVTGNTQTAYCMALHYDLLTDKQRKQAAGHLVERIEAKDYHLSVGFLGVPILLPTLTEIGRSDLAYRLLQNKTYPSWGYSVEQGATTIWERWNSYTLKNGISAEKMNSFNHYAYGACSEWMFYSMLGIDTDGAGYKDIKMKPEIGHGVTWAKGHYDSIRGRISSDWEIEGDTFRWTVEIPANTRATLHVPAGSTSEITEGGRAIPKSKLQAEEGRVMIRVGSGVYTFSAKNF